MLVAKRDSFELGAQDRPLPQAAPTSSRYTRALNALQLVGALIAVPVGIGSAYSMYQTNFSVEASCKALRVGIVRMLDKNVDAGTRHMLVRRDVESFESTCRTVDPDATAAFKKLLAADKAAPVTPAAVPAEPQAQTVMRKSDPEDEPTSETASAPSLKSKPQAARAAVTAPVRTEASLSDTAWVAAVQSALASRDKSHAAQPTAVAPPALAPRPLGTLPVSPAQPEQQTAAPAQMAAPTLPPPAAVAPLPAVQLDPDHPVPPAAIPQAPPAPAHSGLGRLVEHIPFFGKSLADRALR